MIKKMRALLGMVSDPFIPVLHRLRWKKHTSNRKFKGIADNGREIPVIISLTSYPPRIDTVHLAVQSLMMQTVKADSIILWLSEEEFHDKEEDLPNDLLKLKKYGLSISWYKNIKSYKKLIPTLEAYPNSIIITVDDDLYFSKNLVKRLYCCYLEQPQVIQCHRVTKFVKTEDTFERIVGGFDFYKEPSFLNKLSGGAGCLFPPGALSEKVSREDIYERLAPTNDDIWFWAMAVINGTKVNVVKNNNPYLHYIRNTQKVGLYKCNDIGPRLFDIQLRNIEQAYPLFEERLVTEARRFANEKK